MAAQFSEFSVLSRIALSGQVTQGEKVTCIFTAKQPTPDVQGLEYAPLLLPDGAAGDAAVALVEEELGRRLPENDAVTVASFNPTVKALVDKLTQDSDYESKLKYRYLGLMLKPNTEASNGWDEEFDSVPKAIEVLIRALSGVPHGERMTGLRARLAAVDPRYRKLEGTPSARPGFITTLVELGRKQGVVELVSKVQQDTNPHIRLTQEGRQLLGKLGTTVVTPGQLETPRPAETKSDTFITTLRSAKWGPFQEVRTAVYEKIDGLAAKGLTVNSLIRDAVATVRDEGTCLNKEKMNSFPWPRVSSFFLKLLAARPVLISGNEVFSPGLASLDRVVSGLIDEWQLELDGELVLFLLRSDCVIALDDVPDLAGALFNSRRDEHCDRVIDVLTHLRKKNRIEESGDISGVIRIV